MKRTTKGFEHKRPPSVAKHPDFQVFTPRVSENFHPTSNSTSSWWVTSSDAEFTAKQRAEQSRMSASLSTKRPAPNEEIG